MSGSISPPLLETVARRAPVIKCLLQNCIDKRELETALDVSRTTINRAVSSLSDAGCVDHRDGKWEVTLFDQLAYQEYKQLVASYEGISFARPLLGHLPPETSLDVNLFVGADILLAKQPAPHAPITRLEELLQHGQQVKVLSPVILPRYVDLICQQIVEQGTDVDLVLNDDLAEYMWENYRDEIDTILRTENGTLWWLKKEPPFGFVLIDEEVLWFAIYDDEGGLKGAIVNDTDAAVTWATDVFYTHRKQGEEVLARRESLPSVPDYWSHPRDELDDHITCSEN